MGVTVEKRTDARHEVRDFTDIVGGDGRWQRTIFAMVFFTSFASAWHTLVMAFLAPNIDYWCAKPKEHANLSDEAWKLYGIPQVSSSTPDDASHCQRFDQINYTWVQLDQSNSANASSDGSVSGSGLVDCHEWEYDRSVYANTVVSQFDLVCDKAWTISMTNSVFMAGSLTSVIVFGHISDRIGRKPALMTCLVILVASGTICAFSTSYIMFAVSRFFDALGAGGLFVTGFILMMEVVGADSRSIYGIAMEFGWCTGYVLMPLIAWRLKDWFWIQMAITLPCIALASMWWLVPESPRWLLAKHKIEEAQKVLSKAAARNKREVHDMEGALKKLLSTQSTEVDAKGKRKGNLLDLFRTPGLWQRTLNLVFNWFVNSFIYYGLSFNTNDLAGNPFINFAIAGAVEFPAYVITIFVIRSLGRRIPLMTTMVSGGLACLLTVFLSGDLTWVRVPLAMFGKFCITASFAIVYVYTAEIFPTVVRNTGVGTCSMFSRIGSILAPFVKELGHATHPAVPLACYGGLSVASGLLILLLPETNRCNVPDTIQQAADFGRKKVLNASEGVQSTCVAYNECDGGQVLPADSTSRRQLPSPDVAFPQSRSSDGNRLGGSPC